MICFQLFVMCEYYCRWTWINAAIGEYRSLWWWCRRNAKRRRRKMDACALCAATPPPSTCKMYGIHLRICHTKYIYAHFIIWNLTRHVALFSLIVRWNLFLNLTADESKKSLPQCLSLSWYACTHTLCNLIYRLAEYRTGEDTHDILMSEFHHFHKPLRNVVTGCVLSERMNTKNTKW